MHAEIPVVLGSNLSGLLVSLSLSRAGIDHVLVGEDKEPAEVPRLGESLNDTASPELWRLYGRELADCFQFKNHISYFNGNFTTLIHLANPRRGLRRALKFAPEKGVPRYPWFGDGLFHLDRIAFDRAIFHKARAQKQCRFVAARVTHLECQDDRITRIDLDDGTSIDRPRYVFDNTGFHSLVARAASVGHQTLSTPQRVVFTHYRRPEPEPNAPEWWRHGTNLVRLDREHDGVDAIAWVIPINRTLSVGMSVEANDPRSREELMALLDAACKRRGLDYLPLYPAMLPIQELKHRYFVRDRTFGKNWLLVGGTAITIWFPSSAGLWTVTAACSMADKLIDQPALGKHYDRFMRGLLPFHALLETVPHGAPWTSSLQVYRFFAKGSTFIIGRVSNYLRIKHHRYGWFSPLTWGLDLLSLLGKLAPPLLFILMGGMALVRSRLELDRSRQARHFPLYFHTILFRAWNLVRSLPQFLWGAIPRRSLPPPRPPASDELPEDAAA